MPAPSRSSALILVSKIQSLLVARGLSLAEVSRKSRSGSPDSRLGHIPHNLYDAIRSRQFSPSVYQVATLSILSGYRFIDWLDLFGFSLDNVARFQASFAALRTVELDARIYHPRSTIPWFSDVAPASFSAPLVPLSRWLSPGESRRADSLDAVGIPAFRFVKIGLWDAFAFPDLLPGSIVRVNPRAQQQTEFSSGNTPGKNLFLVEHGRGMVCSQICRTGRNRVILCSRHLPYAFTELELGPQAVVVGIADVEIRKTVKIEKPMVPRTPGGYRTPLALQRRVPARTVGEFMQQARKRSGLSFREASKRTRVIAQTLRDSRYFCAPGSLSDYETRKSPPRHIHKLISICAVYFAGVADFLEAAGVQLDGPGQLPMPLDFLEGPKPNNSIGTTSSSSKFMNEIERRFLQLPYFLHGAMPSFFGISDLSIRDVFWAGGVERFVHPYMDGSAFLIVDRRKKTARSSLSWPKWAQPLYVFLRHDGNYLCGSYSRLNGILIIHPCTAGLPKLLRLRHRTDVEIVGQIVGIVRRLK